MSTMSALSLRNYSARQVSEIAHKLRPFAASVDNTECDKDPAKGVVDCVIASESTGSAETHYEYKDNDPNRLCKAVSWNTRGESGKLQMQEQISLEEVKTIKNGQQQTESTVSYY